MYEICSDCHFYSDSSNLVEGNPVIDDISIECLHDEKGDQVCTHFLSYVSHQKNRLDHLLYVAENGSLAELAQTVKSFQ